MSHTLKIPENLATQINAFADEQSARCAARVHDATSRERIEQNFAWVKAFAAMHFESRIQRAEDLQSADTAEAQKLARDYIGERCHDFFATCVDGRNMPSIMFSKPPHVGGVLRTPAGVVGGFLPGQNPDHVFIDRSSFVVQRIIELLREKVSDTIFYGLDSHLGCAARGQMHETEGGRQQDAGLRTDVLNKMMTARGIVQMRNELIAAGETVAEIIPTFFSFDPHDGGVLMGLEAQVDRAEIASDGFTPENLAKLAQEGLILRTHDLLMDTELLRELSSVIKSYSADFRKNYVTSLLTNWRAITRLYANADGTVFKHILRRLTESYTRSGWTIDDSNRFDKKHISDKALRQKAKFLLKNIVTRYSIAGTEHKWPYDTHSEEMTVITDGGYAPFASIDAFAVFSKDLNGLLPNTKLTIDLLRSFRRNGKIHNRITEPLLSAPAFAAAPIFISNKAIIKNLSDASWKALERIDFGNVLSRINWDDPEVLAWRKSDIATLMLTIVESQKVTVEMDGTLRLVSALYELFNRMRLMMSDKQFRQMIMGGNIVIFNTVVDRNRLPRIVLNMAI